MGSLELMDVLSRKAYSMGVCLSVSNVSNLAVEHLNLSVKEFWANYKLYLIGSLGRDNRMLETFEKTKMGQIVAVFAKLYKKKTVYEEIVRDVLWEFEEFYAREYGTDISDLVALVSQFETKKNAFEADEHYKILQKIIEAEKSEGVMVLTSLVNDDSSSLDAVLATPMKCQSKKSVLIEVKSFVATPMKYEGGKIDFIEEEELEVFKEGLEKSKRTNKCMSAGEKTEVLKDRAKKLRKLRKESKPISDSNGKTVVEIDEYGKPNGKGRRELVHFLTVKTLATYPSGIIVSSMVGKQTIDKIIDQGRECFSGDWISSWAIQSIKATLRQRKAKVVKQLRSVEYRKDLKMSLFAERFKAAEKLLKDPTFLNNSERLKATREKVQKLTHSRRGGFAHIRMRYFQEHHEDPSSEKIREIADTVAEKKMDVE